MTRINYIATMISESYVWVGYGATAEEAKEMICRKWKKYLGDKETTVRDMEKEYCMNITECASGEGIVMPV